MRALICRGEEGVWHSTELSIQPYIFNVGVDERCSETL